MKLSEKVQKVVALGDAIRNYWDVELPKRHRDYPLVHPGEDSGPPPPQEKELNALLSSMPACELYKLLLIMHLGRWDFGVDDLAGRYETLKERYDTPERAVAHAMQMVTVADYLTDGLARLHMCGIDADHFALAAVG